MFKVSTAPALVRLALQTATCIACAASAGQALAERPMSVDDAGTLALGAKKFEGGWSRDDTTRGLEMAVGFAPLENLELELAIGRARDRGTDLRVDLQTVGATIKSTPLQTDEGLSAGIKLGFARDSIRHGQASRVQARSVLLSWAFEQDVVVHLNLGHELQRTEGSTEAAGYLG